jgi:molecular chaperone DnaJ
MLARTRYAILGVTRTESGDGLRRVFRKLVKRYHPDRAGPGATAPFQRIVNAYRTLERDEWRNRYNEGIEDAFGRSGALDPVMALGEGAKSTAPAGVTPIQLTVASLLALETLARLVSEQPSDAENSRSSGWEPLDLAVTIASTDALRGGWALLVLPACYPCSECGGAGRVGHLPCEACDGNGVELEEERICVNIPRLSPAYTRLELPVSSMGILGRYLRLHVWVR